jgi:hypothetical protein
MATIIAGKFDEQTEVEATISALRAAGFPADDISTFFLTPAGQHARYALGGDHDISPGAEDSAQGAVAGSTAGGMLGAAIGAVTTPFTGPIGAITGALVGAHVGNLVGALGKMKDDENPEDAPPIRHAGLIVAVKTSNAQSEECAIAVLRAHGAQQLESSAGQIVRGDWEDFDPASPPHLIDAQHRLRPPGAGG